MTSYVEERQYQILIVEDDPVNISVILNCIGNQYQLYIAKTREKAFQIIETTAIDLVLLDINLPDGNGFEICKELIDHKHIYGDMHVVFMTGMAQPEDEARGINLGANDYITKPINETVLKARVNLQIKLIRQTELLSNLARIDGTTEVNNRRAFDDHLQTEWNRSQRDQTPISLCLLDIDFFKQYNDTYGHPAGDDCLRNLAKCLKTNFQRGSDFVARYGGEEFAIILNKTDAAMSEHLIQKLLDDFIEFKILHEKSTVSEFVTFSAGISSIVPRGNTTPEMLLASADKQLYKAKAAGRARVCAQVL